MAATSTAEPRASGNAAAMVAPARVEQPLPEEDVRNWDWLADVQSVLASTAFHLVALILLGFLAAAADRPAAPVQRVEVQLGPGDDPVRGVEGMKRGGADLDQDITEEVAAAVEKDLFEPKAMSDVSSVETETPIGDVTAPVDPFGDNSITSDLESALGGPGMGGTGLGDVGTGADAWSGEGSPWGKDNPGADFFGLGSRGGSFVYVVDMSGSMNEAGKWERATAELLRSIKHLDKDQKYFIVFFSDGAYPMDGKESVLATPRQIDKTTRWVKRIWPGGGTFPMEALLQAIALEPDAIYFLSDGRFDPAVIETMKERNPRRRGQVPIHTISFVNRETIGIMKKIAKDSGGKFRFVE
jgi:hypothetical protein